MALVAAALAAGCSVVPPRAWPAFAEHTVRAEYPVTPGAAVELPVSDRDLVVLSLAIEPRPLAELWRDGRRLVQPAAGSTRLVVTCRYRAYAIDGQVPAPDALFPGAAVTELRP